MTAFAGDLNFMGAGVLAGIAAIFLAMRDGTKTRFVGALLLFVCHWNSPSDLSFRMCAAASEFGRVAIVARHWDKVKSRRHGFTR
jgi:hypothetical protein